MYYVYGLKCIGDSDYRYVGLTTSKPSIRLASHLSDAFTRLSPYAVHGWIRKHGRNNIIIKVLEECPEDRAYLGYAERYWIRSLRELGHRLLNITAGGEGKLGCVPWNKGVPMSAEQKQLLRAANLGKIHTEGHKKAISNGVVKHFEENGHKSVYQFWVDKYGEAEALELQRAKQAKASRSLVGVGNPMYGRTGPLAPCYGRVGDKHPMYGNHHTDEAKKKISEKTKGKPKSEATRLRMSFAQHTRSHMAVSKPTCRWCLGDSLADAIKEKDIILDGDVG